MSSEFLAAYLSEIGKAEIVQRKLTDLDVGRAYRISSIRSLNTRFGRRILVVLESKYNVWLPRRFTSLTEEQIEELSKGDLALVYKGLSTASKTAIINFEAISTPLEAILEGDAAE